jgi:hypothetical protein
LVSLLVTWIVWAEFFRSASSQYATLAELQAALDAWVADYNTARPHQSCGGLPAAERFQLDAQVANPREELQYPATGWSGVVSASAVP